MNKDRLKFRFYDKKCKMYCPDGHYINGDKWMDDYYESVYDLPEYIVPEQCTGLKDKNGNLTYEGDLIKTANYKTGCPEIYVVKWCDECGLYQLESTQSDQIIDMYRAEKGVICGNIHEQKDNK